MLVLGLNGGFSPLHEEFAPNVEPVFFHDAAAALVEDGRVVAAVEEERLSRLKHTNKFGAHAVAYCLAERGATLRDVDRVAFFFGEDYVETELGLFAAENPGLPHLGARELLGDLLHRATGDALPPDRLSFIDHHLAHATSALVHSGFSSALVAVFDGNGDDESATLSHGDELGLRTLARHPVRASLGHLYSSVIQLLGFGAFDEYKAMGLAPLGDPARHRPLLRSLYELGPDGGYELDHERARPLLLRAGLRPRRRGEDFRQQDRDLAAALQEAVEEIALHVILRWQGTTGHRRLVLAGGVAQNVTLNGRLATSGRFDDIFVDPAAHDAGAAVGAALAVPGAAARPGPRLVSANWGPAVDRSRPLAAELAAWGDVLDCRRLDRPAEAAAELLAGGAIIGWVQGRSEFGPRALGNRSILADPTMAENRDLVNAAVKKRESFRPFAPSVTAEAADRYFELALPAAAYSFMSFAVRVRESARQLLPAVTHVDGSARVHVVAEADNPRFWRLITCFGDSVGVPVVLNTSFNNNAEPIVQSGHDAVVGLLTCGLTALVIDDHLVRPAAPVAERLPGLRPGLAASVGVRLVDGPAPLLAGPLGPARWEVWSSRAGGPVVTVSEDAARILRHSGGDRSVAQLGGCDGAVADELVGLWARRLITLQPAYGSGS